MVDPHQVLVTAAQMRAIEQAMFAAGMSPAALMEKAALQVTRRLTELYPPARFGRVGVLVGPGHNGGDGLVVARELHLQGRTVCVHRPLPSTASLLQDQARYGEFLGLVPVPLTALADCDVLVDGLLGLGTTRPPAEPLAAAIAQGNAWPMPKVAIDVPSGLDSDRGVPLGETLRADRTLCLGLWKRGLWQEAAVPYVGVLERLDWGVPAPLVPANSETLMNPAASALVGDRPLPESHKYQNGRLLVVAGSRRFGGAALLAVAGGRGVGMLYVAVPQTLQPLIWQMFPEAVVLPCPETPAGAIAALPDLDWGQFDAIAAGPGLTPDLPWWPTLWQAPVPLVADADLLKAIAQRPWVPRAAPTVLTPHAGEFRRLFPELASQDDRLQAVTQAAQQTGAIVLHKGHRTVVSDGRQTTVNPESTAALARGGSGDVLTGAIGALLARGCAPWTAAVTGTLWHAQTARRLAARSSERSVDPLLLAHHLYQP
ncbi:MAG: NAD(P)H-hydrate dehydratase [Pseudanabaenaceae cyanobacterium]